MMTFESKTAKILSYIFLWISAVLCILCLVFGQSAVVDSHSAMVTLNLYPLRIAAAVFILFLVVYATIRYKE